MRVLELFAGIGGISLGLERAGMKTVAMVEIDRACRFWLRSNYPNIPILGNIHSVTKARLQRNGIEEVDLIAGGFPCQPHSVAGKRKGQQDKRHLWPEFARLVREIRPRWVLAENVLGIRTTAADEVLADLGAAGYSCWPLVVGADNVGAPHRRKRAWFVAYRNGLRKPQSEGSERHERGWACYSREGLGDSNIHRLQGQPDRGHAHEAAFHDSRGAFTGTAWPSRPGEPQYEWEAPRLARHHEPRADTQSPPDERDQGGHSVCEPSSRRGEESRDTQPRMGVSVDGIPARLARSGAAARRARLKALGNAVVPQVAEAIGRAILRLDTPPVAH